MKKRDHTHLFAHFHPSEHAFVERCLDWIAQTVYNHQVVTTPFLDPREQQILTSLVRNQQEITCVSEGGMESAERNRLKIGQPFLLDTNDQSLLSYLRLTIRSGNQLSHGQVLGSLLGLGIRRDQVGDIYLRDDGCDVVVTAEMAMFIQLHLSRVGKESVYVNEIAPVQISPNNQMRSPKKIVVPSLRLDAILSEGFHVPREKVSNLIKSGKCKVDWKVTDRPSDPVEKGDLLSLRGYGRLFVESIEGKTKKGKIVIKLSIPS